MLAACRVRVPCTTSNLGAGFDCLGLALDRYLEASFEPGGTTLSLERSGTLAELDALDVPVARDRLAAAFNSRLARAPGRPNGVLRVTSEIPIAKGLGSSAAATIAGLVLARAASGYRPSVGRSEPHARSATGDSGDDVRRARLAVAGKEPPAASPSSRFEWLEVAAEAVAIEGHPDNVGPALLGGLVVALPALTGGSVPATLHPEPESKGGSEPVLRRLPLSPDIGFAFAAPPAPVDTAAARAMLPATVPFAMAARSLPRVAALLYGLAHADAECLRAGFDDELHVPHRLPLIPGGAAALAAAREAGAWAATISGSGSGLIAACPAGIENRIADAMCEALRLAAGHAVGFPLRPDTSGTRLVEA